MTKFKPKKKNIVLKSFFNILICLSPCLLLIFVAMTILIIRRLQFEQKHHLHPNGMVDKDSYDEKYFYYDDDKMNNVGGNKEATAVGVNDIIDEKLNHILHGNVHLIQLNSHVTFNHDNSDRSSHTKPYTTQGIFCHLSWNLHKTNPSRVPMNKDLIKQSKKCKGSTIQYDIYEAATKIREYDNMLLNNKQGRNDSSIVSVTNIDHAAHVHTMKPTGFVFHESRCGSTLVANSLAAFDPEKNRVYSESDPPITAAKLFDSNYEEESIQLLRDVIFLMGKLFHKIIVLSVHQYFFMLNTSETTIQLRSYK